MWQRSVKLLLINPKFPESFWSFKWAIDHVLTGKRAINPPLGLATLAALCPEDWQVEIIDENIESVPLEPQADIIGICGMGVQFKRQKELLTFYKNKGYFVVAGGSYASLCPEEYENLPHTIIAGEAEYIWKEFCADFAAGKPRSLYQETGVVSLADSPVPRFDLLKLDKYQSVGLQFSRGCPFSCEFCDIIVMFGRVPRTKSPDQIGRELDQLRKRDIHNVFFVDDNLIGNKRMAKDLLKFLKDYQQRHNYQFQFGTEASLNLASDDDLLQLFREANFVWVFIGIETPDENSLRETKKLQNTRQDILASVQHIYSYGIDIFAGFIIGFDNDTIETFARQYQFIMESGIQSAMVGLLMALPKTPLYKRLQREGRLIPHKNNADNTKLGTNFLPKQMNYADMVHHYCELYKDLLEHRHIADRIRNKIRHLKDPVYQGEHSFTGQLRILGKFIVHGLMRGGVSRLFHFLRSIPFFKPKLIPLMVQDWILGLAMQNYVKRHFIEETAEDSRLSLRYLPVIERVFERYFRQGALEASLDGLKTATANLSISLKGWLERDFFVQAGRHLEKILKNTTTSLTLHIEEFHENQIYQLKCLLNRLSPYGDRIYINIRKELMGLITIDSSVFNLVLEY